MECAYTSIINYVYMLLLLIHVYVVSTHVACLVAMEGRGLWYKSKALLVASSYIHVVYIKGLALKASAF